MSSQSLTEKLASFIVDTSYENLPSVVVEQVKMCMLDFLGVALAGSMTVPGRIIIDFVNGVRSHPEATVISSHRKVPCAIASLANGTMAHCLELDDGNRRAMGHPGVVTIPPALATAELYNCDGKDLVTSITIGYDVFARIGSAVNPSHFERGFHTTGTCGTIAAAAAAGKLLNLDKSEMVNALGLAGTQASGLFEFVSDGSMSKPLHPGVASHGGVLAALLAKKGFTGPRTILEGKRGFFKAMSDFYKPKEVTNQLGKRFRVLDTYFKFHAACRHAHPAIDSALKISKENPINIEEIEKIFVKTYRAACEATNIYNPETILSAKLSTPFSVAIALIKGKAGLDEYSEESIRNKRVLQLSQRVIVSMDEKLDKLVPEKRGAIVKIKMKDGTEFEHYSMLPRGEPELPASKEELREKFRNLTREVVKKERIERIIEKIENLEKLTSLSELCSLLY